MTKTSKIIGTRIMRGRMKTDSSLEILKKEIAKHEITATITDTGTPGPSDWWGESTLYKVILKMDGRKMSVPNFYMETGWTGGPEIAFVLECLLLDYQYRDANRNDKLEQQNEKLVKFLTQPILDELIALRF